ncbi:TMEM165/GDT1 family protein [Anoxynatronum sibiricum]|uniref:TMEM165/GDT1 family protein n=1 Tax=Anoxynatronum sibiricum TaxID=210623 RepID=A0ABU9VYE6_9CLOT
MVDRLNGRHGYGYVRLCGFGDIHLELVSPTVPVAAKQMTGGSALNEMAQAFLLIFLAEMGDKTQILAMTFATRYPMRKVLAGVFLGSLINHGMAVFVGTFLTVVLPVQWLGAIASVSFLFFGYWALLASDDETETRMLHLGPVLTVATAFFVGELGDKTQLTAMALATQSGAPLATLAGTTMGMVGVSALGIMAGKLLGDRVPEVALKLIAANVFFVFGVVGLYNTLPKEWIHPYSIAVFAALIVITALPLMRRAVRVHRLDQTALKDVAVILKLDLEQIRHSVDRICNDKAACASCGQDECPVFELETLIEEAVSRENAILKQMRSPKIKVLREFKRQHLYDTLKVVYTTCRHCQPHHETCVLNQTRLVLEKLLFGHSLVFQGDWDQYLEQIHQEDHDYYHSHLQHWHETIKKENRRCTHELPQPRADAKTE